jgi:hypothetical protein
MRQPCGEADILWLGASDFPLRMRTGMSMVRSGSAVHIAATAPRITGAKRVAPKIEIIEPDGA